jgi:hypothetical protein
VLTWPEGNGWLVRQMQAPMAAQIRSSCAVWNVEPEAGGVRVDYYDDARQKSVRLRVRGVVWAAPQFVARRVIRPFREQSPSEPVYSPWLVANLTLDALPGGRDAEVAWDNVLYSSRSLGYVVATHQNLQPVPGATVITYFRPLDEGEPAAVRQRALTCSYDDWCDLILEDLGVAHPGIADQVRQLDVWLWGHAMVRPVPGFIWGAARERMQQPLGNIVFAHSDLSGVAIFEEAYNRGVRAAAALLQKLESSVRKS